MDIDRLHTLLLPIIHHRSVGIILEHHWKWNKPGKMIITLHLKYENFRRAKMFVLRILVGENFSEIILEFNKFLLKIGLFKSQISKEASWLGN